MIRIFLFLISMNFTTLVYSAEAVITNIDDDLISLNFNQTKSTIILQSLADFHQMNLIVDEIIDTTQTVKLNVGFARVVYSIRRKYCNEYA